MSSDVATGDLLAGESAHCHAEEVREPSSTVSPQTRPPRRTSMRRWKGGNSISRFACKNWAATRRSKLAAPASHSGRSWPPSCAKCQALASPCLAINGLWHSGQWQPHIAPRGTSSMKRTVPSFPTPAKSLATASTPGALGRTAKSRRGRRRVGYFGGQARGSVGLKVRVGSPA